MLHIVKTLYISFISFETGSVKRNLLKRVSIYREDFPKKRETYNHRELEKAKGNKYVKIRSKKEDKYAENNN